MNRVGLGLAVGAGYLLGRTKKAKLAFAVGSLVAGKKLNLGPRALADLLNQQLKDNPQFKEIGDQLRQDLRGVGKAASGAMVERQMTALADRLHGRTAQVRDELAGAVPDGGSGDGAEDGRQDGDGGDGGDDDYEDRGEGREADEDQGQDAREESRRKEPAKKSPADPAKKAARKAPAAEPAEKAAKKAPARKAAAKKTAPARKAAAKKTAAAGRASGAARSRSAKGGGER
ncbi:DNA primase [Streptomyces sp. NPDC059631]|uniref:DNA primase n=1 Tax=unclassified Streptomyces TaxID=2593676 RepID=UPI0036CD23AD